MIWLEKGRFTIPRSDGGSTGECPCLASEEEDVRLREGSVHDEVVVLRCEFQIGYCEWDGLCKVRQCLAVILQALLVSQISGHDHAVMLREADYLVVLDVPYVVAYVVVDPVVGSEKFNTFAAFPNLLCLQMTVVIMPILRNNSD